MVYDSMADNKSHVSFRFFHGTIEHVIMMGLTVVWFDIIISPSMPLQFFFLLIQLYETAFPRVVNLNVLFRVILTL